MVVIPAGAAGHTELITTGTSPTLAEPSGIKVGDVLFVAAVCAVAGAMVRPAGWTPLFLGVQGAFQWDVAWVRRGQAAPSLTWTLTGSVYQEIYLVRLTSLNGAGPVLLHAQSASGAAVGSSTAKPDPPPVTITVPSALVLCTGANWAGSITSAWGCPGYTAETTNAIADDACLFSKAVGAAGIEDPAVWTTGTITPGNDLWNGATVAFTDEPFLTAGYSASPAIITKRFPRQQRLSD